jgi:hypothetical protein
MMFRTGLFAFIIALSFHSCKTAKKSIVPFQHERIVLERTPCFGTCPQYTLTIASDGSMIYEGKRFTNMTGMWTANISPVQVDSLFKLVHKADLSQYQAEYPSPYSDLPSVIIVHQTLKKQDKIRITGEHPAALDNIVQTIESFSKKGEWRNENLK